MIRILEISWLVLGIIALVLGMYKIFSDGAAEAAFYGVVMMVSIGMFVIRRKQRMKLDKES
jgi:uncharacterized membrane protein YiaA